MANQQGWSQQTPAIQSLLRTSIGGTRRVGGSRKRAKKSASASGRSIKKRRKSAGKRASGTKRAARLVKGSAAARAYMAKIRKLRKK